MPNKNNKRRRNNNRPNPIPGAPSPHPPLKSRRLARKITTQFHKVTTLASRAQADGDLVLAERLGKEAEEMREGYQEASRLSTRFHSTSRWVLKVLSEMGWSSSSNSGVACGEGGGKDVPMPLDGSSEENDECEDGVELSNSGKVSQKRRCKVLEVGAINTELIDAASRTRRVRADRYNKSISSSSSSSSSPSKPIDATQTIEDSNEKTTTTTATQYINIPTTNLTVRAIDLHSSHPSIEQSDFLTLPTTTTNNSNNNNSTPPIQFYDAIVCSMVLNCVPTPTSRGTMLTNIHTLLHPGGLCFLVVPLLCLTQSKYLMNAREFEDLLTKGVGFEVERKKVTPKLAFWVLRKGREGGGNGRKVGTNRWGEVTVRNRGKKYRNEFCVVLT